MAWDNIVVKGHGKGCSPGAKVAKWECWGCCSKMAGWLGMFHIRKGRKKLGGGQNRKTTWRDGQVVLFRRINRTRLTSKGHTSSHGGEESGQG